MTKHLFLEGPIQSGKSTLIKNCLREFKGTLGGFSCKRYRDENGNVCAFGLVKPTDFDVDGIYDSAVHGVSGGDLAKGPGNTSKDSGIFLAKGNHGMQADTDAFIRTATALLDASKDVDLILMDEIGGVELMSDTFRRRLGETLSGDIPCIGALKQQTHAKVMQEHHADECEADIIGANEQLRKDIIKKYNGTIVPFDRTGIDDAKAAIMQFLEDITK